MSTTETAPQPEGGTPARTGRNRALLITLLVVLILVIVALTTILIVYLISPAPLPDLIPIVELDYEPHYLFSIYGVDQPVGIALSPDAETIYVSESGGERLIRSFDRDGNALATFAAAGTSATSRSPVYLDVDASGRVFVTDRLQDAIFVFDAGGTYLDTLLDPDDALSEYVATSACGLEQGTFFSFNTFESLVRCTPPGGAEQTLPVPPVAGWSPLGVRFSNGSLLVTDLREGEHQIRIASGDSTEPARVSLATLSTGGSGQEPDQLLFPNVAVADSQGRVYVTDGNNGRVSIWDSGGNHLGIFGTGSGDGGLSLPRGAAINDRDRLHVVDAVGQDVKVYDVSGDTPEFLFTFGGIGIEDGQFSFPNDIAIDETGRLYITDRENGRIQVWSY